MNREVNRDKIDILKAFAIIAVIAIHTISQTFQFYNPASFSWHLVLFADQIIRFSVPLFVALSGFTLAYKYKDQEKIDFKEFFNRRVLKLLPLYIFWSVLIYLYLRFFGYLSGEGVGSNWWQLVFLGRVDYHLYFVPMIFQLYLLFPFLLKLVNKYKLKFVSLLFVLEAYFYYLIGIHTEKIPSDQLWTDQNTYVFFGAWVFYFTLGIFLAKNMKLAKAHKYLAFIVAILGVIWNYTNAIHLLGEHINLLVITRFTQVPVLIFATGAIVLTIVWGERLTKLPGFLHKQLVQVGRESYLVYLMHTMLIRLIFDILHIPLRESAVVFTLTITLLTVICVRLWYQLVKRVPFLKILE